MLLTKEWLDERLNKIENYETILLFKEEVEAFIKSKSFVSRWPIDEFFIVIWSTLLAEDLSGMKNIQPGIGNNKGCLFTYPPSYFEIQETVSTFHSIFDQTLLALNQLKITHSIEEIDLPIVFLELIESASTTFHLSLRMTRHYKVIESQPKKIPPLLPEDYIPSKITEELCLSPKRFLIVPWLAELIRFQHYKLDPTIAKRGIFPVPRLTIDEAAKYLSISVNQLIEKCFEEETLGVYLKEGQFKVKKFITTSSQCLFRSYIEKISTLSYPYKYKGLVRLVKSSELYPDKTLENIHEGSIIQVSPKAEFAIVPLLSSIAECTQGINQVIDLRKGQKIIISDLIFIGNELDKHRKTPQKNTNNEPSALKKLIVKVMEQSGISKPQLLWGHLQDLVGNEKIKLITDLDDWSETDPRLYYKISKGVEANLGKKRFQNLIAELIHYNSKKSSN